MPTSKSHALYRRAQAVIPKGVYGHYGPAIIDDGPVFFSSAEGARFTDLDGNTYIDWMCAYGPNILGYGHPRVEEAAAKQAADGTTVSLAAPVLVDLAEELVDLVAGADWALFAKNGADATGLAVMVARAATGRRRILKIEGGYHGSAPWMQAPGSTGTVDEDHDLVIEVPWNDADAVRAAIAAHPGDIACFISSPYHHPVFADNEQPADGYWSAVETACRAAGVVVILDDVRSGFRIDLSGSHAAYGFTPDLWCFGKALGNGHPVAALAGSAALKDVAGETFFTGTQFFNAAPMAAALATLRELRATDAAAVATDTGGRLRDALVEVANAHGHELRVTGVAAMPYLRITGEGGTQIGARWVAECVRRGAYLLGYHNNFVCTAHTDDDITRTCDIADAAFVALA
ncbi:aminotransferase class III-fold pyridoxal phosphate-dependent enzyme [Candidatus Poriferisodalis sp.]|uniref:aminotransferase class III-fold pyridoxal phosphate-dependent enzyme n=1 Tax=Candidatus Poriferisodalis sp. TaxID=3101277 RepID=UPI003B010E8E